MISQDTQNCSHSSGQSGLFRPARFGSVALKNRLVMAPMTRCKSPGHVPNQQNVEYYRRRAAGGVALIITEGATIDHPAANGYRDVPSFAGEAALRGWADVARAVREQGCAIVPQLWHVGSVRTAGTQPDPAVPGYGPSPVAHPLNESTGELPRELTEADIADLLAAYGRAAADAERLGFDGVEIHAAHGYLIDQFFWSRTNRRTDGYGGDAVARTRFAREVIEAVRARVSPRFPVCMRISQFKLGDYECKPSRSPAELDRWLAPLAGAGVDLFHCSTRRFDTPEFEGSELNLAGWVKKLCGKPTITCGSVGLRSDFTHAEDESGGGTVGIERLLERLERLEFDLVAVGRALLADPEWPSKLASGRTEAIEAFRKSHLQRYP